MSAEIINIRENSLADKAGIRSGTKLEKINGLSDFDIIDFMLESSKDIIELKISDEGGTEKDYRIINDNSAPLGIDFENITIDPAHVCENNCIFCFMNQLPKNMRKTLYFKDDDYRLSFLFGNYITLTNVSGEQISRMNDLKMSPVNISLHAADVSIRKQMMRNNNADRISEQLSMLRDGGCEFNIQLVLCPGINDGDVLSETLNFLLGFSDCLISLSSVPVGLTAHREGLAELQLFDAAGASDVIDITNRFRQRAFEMTGRYIFCASDEFYLLSGRDLPPDSYYEEYAQYENGVGMLRTFIGNMAYGLEQTLPEEFAGVSAAVLTGVLTEGILNSCISDIKEKYPNAELDVICIENWFFGKDITVSGLVCGCDIINQLAGTPYKNIIIPSNMINEDDVFLDDIHIEELQMQLSKKIYTAAFDGSDFYEILKETGE